MESQLETTQTVFALKLPVLKIGKYDLWSMGMEQYFNFTDHPLWEVIVNSDSVSPVASASAGIEGPIPPKTAKQNLARKNKLKAKSTLMLAIPNEHLLKFYASWNNIALIMRNKSDLDTLNMDNLYNNLKVYESEMKIQSNSSLNSHNAAFVSSHNSSNTNEIINTAYSVSVASSKDQASTASYINDVMFSFFSNQSNAPQLDNEDLEQIDTDDLEEMDIKWKTKVECYNCYRRGHFARECKAPRNQGNRNRDASTRNAPVDTSTTNALVVQDGIGYQMGLESLEARIVVHEKNEAVYKEDIAYLKYDVQTGLGYDSQMNGSDLNDIHVNESEVLNNAVDSRESDGNDKQVNDRFKKGGGYHAIPPSYTGNYMPPRADLSFARLDNSVFKYKESDSEDENVFKPKEVKKTVKPSLEKTEFVNARNTTVENENKAEKPWKFSQSPRVRRHFKQKSVAKTNNLNEKVNTAKVNNVTTARAKAVVSAAEGNKNNVVKSSTCKIWRPKGNLVDHISKDNGSYTFKRFNYVDPQGRLNVSQMCDKKNNVLFTDTECVVLSPDFKLLDESQILLKVPGNNNMYSFDLKNVVPVGAKEGDKNDQENDLRNQEEAPRNQFEQESKRLFGQWEAANTNSTNRLNTVSSTVNAVSSFFTNVDLGRERAQRNKFESMFRQDKNANGNRMFTPVGAARSTYVNLGGSIPIHATTLPNADLLTDPLMPDLEDTADLHDTRIFSGAYDDKFKGAVADFNNLELTTFVSPIPTTRIHKDHPKEQIIGDTLSNCLFACFLFQMEPKKVIQALSDPSWIEAMQDELLQFRLHKVWRLVDLPKGKHAIRTKWVYRNKKDERGIVVRNKARLVAQGYTQEEEIDYDEVFAHVARIEAIRLFLAYASFVGFIVYQMDVKSAFLYGTIEEEVYVCQPPGFEDPYFPNKVYKVEKALYGLHQAPRAWYKTLSTYSLENKFRRGIIDKTLFIKKDKGDLLLVQVYVDDTIFGSTKKYLCIEFKGLMHKKFKMSSIRELTFFLGLQVMQKDDEIFICQDKYVADILKKFDFSLVKTVSTLIETNKALIKDEQAKDVDVHLYKSMIGSLMYLTASRPDIMFDVYACARFQVALKVSHLHVVKRIFRYLKGQPRLGLWYLRDSPFDLEAFSDSDYAGAILERKSITGGCQFLRKRLILWQCKKQTVVANSTTKAEYVAATNCYRHVLWIQNQMLDYGFSFMNTKIYIDNESTICIVKNPVLDLEDAKTAQAKEIASLKKRVKKLEQKRKSRTSKLKRLRKVETARRVESLTKSSLGDQEDASKQGRLIDNIDQDVEITLVDDTHGRMNEEDMFGVNDLDGDEVVVDVLASENLEQSVKVVEKEVSTADPVTTAAKPKAITTAATTFIAAGTRAKAKGIVMQEPSVRSTPKPIDSSQKPSQSKDKGKGKMVKPERPLKRKDQIMMDEEVAKNLKAQMQAELEEEEERLARLKEEETNIALNSRLFVELMDMRKKHFTRLKAEKIRSKPPTKAQKRNQMCTYLKNMANYKHNQLKNKSFEETQLLFNNTMKWIAAFVPMDTELVKGSDKAVEDSKKVKKGSSKRVGNNLEQEYAKRQRLEKENETIELKKCLEIILEDDNDVTIKATPLSSKSSTIVDYKIYKERKKKLFQKH
nr:putative ribonuclease H-like domain-containing protein [Tanacetum cinerariifolium]